MVDLDTRKKFAAKKIFRGSQLIYGERQHLENVHRSVQSAKMLRARKQAEISTLNKLIRARTEELNGINPAWDSKFKKARDPQTAPKKLLKLATSLSEEDYLMARALTEHKGAPGELLAMMASHPYAAVRENVARHPNTPHDVLRKLAETPSEPLWFLVACNPSTPEDLRQRLRARMRELAPE